MNYSLLRNKNALFILIVILTALISNIILYLFVGFRDGADSVRYINGANSLLCGEPLRARQLSYVGYIWFLYFFKWLGLNLEFVYLAQILFGILASIAAYYLGKQYGDETTGLICGLVWALFLYAHFWNFYILTDAIFISFVMFSLSFVLYSNRKSIYLLFFAVLSILLMASIRINGVIFGFFLVASLVMVVPGWTRKAVIILAGGVLLLLPSSPLSHLFFEIPDKNSIIADRFLLTFMIDGEVNWHTVQIQMPKQTIFTGSAVKDTLYYIAGNFGDVLKLWILRIHNFLYTDNPNYSVIHILVNYVVFTVIHVGFLVGIILVFLRKRVYLLVPVGIVFLQISLVMLTTNDYDGRYLLYSLPGELPFFAVTINAVFDRMLRNE